MQTPDSASWQAQPEEAHAILARVASPLFLFSSVLAMLLCLSWFFLLPRATKVDIGGEKRGVEELSTYRSQLTSAITANEEKRAELASPVSDERYHALIESRASGVPFDRIETDVTAQATAAGQHVRIDRISYDADTKTVRVDGDVNAETQSMTMLAHFVDLLRRSSLVGSLIPPRYVREVDSAGKAHSPFSLSFTLR